MKYKTTILKVAVHRESINPIFGEGVINIELEDEAAGPFILLSQNDVPGSDFDGKVAIDFTEDWAHVVAAVEMLRLQFEMDKP